MLHISTSRSSSIPRTLCQRVGDAVASHATDRVWARASGPHVLLGFRGSDEFARVTPLGGASYGLAFRALDAANANGAHGSAWEPLFLVDDLASVVEHALVAVGVLDADT
jgi:hypothetical protein